MKKTFIIALCVILGFASLGVARDQLIRLAVSGIGSYVLGAPLRMRGFSLGVMRQSVSIKGFTLGNPAGFPRGLIIDLPLVRVDFDAAALLKGRVHLPQVAIILKEVGLFMNKDGVLNVDSLKVVQGKERPAPKERTQLKKKQARQMPFQIDLLSVDIGRVVSKDYSAGPEPVIQVYEVNLKKNYRNVNSPRQLAGIVLSEPLKAAGIKGATIYGIAALSGAAFLPVAAGVTLAGKDSASAEFGASVEQVFEAALSVVKKMGTLTREDKKTAALAAKINGASVALKAQARDGKTHVTVSARKYALPRPEIASGVLYELSQAVK